VESLPLEPGRPDVVRVMNLHKAKGLEADVVFLVDPCGGAAKHADVRIVRSGAEARGYFLLIRRKKGSWARDVLGEPPGWAAHQAEEEKYLEAEEKRLLYVAATRARQMLVVGRWAKPTGGSRPRAVFSDQLAGVPALKVPADASVPTLEAVDVSGAVADAARAARDGKHEAVRAASWSASSEVLARARARRA
jgi:ATP-dependent helicase/nuclease subunit A